MPIFVPSKEFIIKLNILVDRTLQSHYCLKMPVIFDIQFYNFSRHPYSPNIPDYIAQEASVAEYLKFCRSENKRYKK